MSSETYSTNRQLLQMMTSLSQRITQIERNVELIKGHLADHATNATTHTIVEQARQNIVSAMCFNNPYNVVFYGIPLRPDASSDGCFRMFMVEMLQIEQDRAFTMAIFVQRLGRMSREEPHPPVCVSFRSVKDLKLVQDKAKKLHIMLARSGIWAKWPIYLDNGALHIFKNNKWFLKL